MKSKLAEAAEGAGLRLGLWIVWLSALAWIGVIAAKSLFYGESLAYGYFPQLSGETYPILWTSGVLLTGIVYCTVKTAVTGVPQSASVVAWLAPRILGFSGVSFALWLLTGPSPSASLVPAIALVAFSSWCWYVSEWGFLSGRTGSAQARTQATENRGQEDAATCMQLSNPSICFSDILGNEDVKMRLREATSGIIVARKEARREPRNGILLHGDPGNGKTIFAQALAGELRLPLVTLTYADVASQWVGEKSARVRAAFEHARRSQPCVLFIDEVDSFLESRDGRPDGLKEDRDLVNALLTLLVDIRHSRVILVAATNHIERLDSAGIREGRFDFKVEITPPDLPARIGLLRRGLADNVPRARVDEDVIHSIAQRWNGFSVKRILAVTEELPFYLRATGAQHVGFNELMGALRQLQGQRGHVPENVKPLSDLVLADSTRETLEQIVARLSDPQGTERRGGTLPTGVLFFGPPGTGKTAACKAVAHAVGCAFLPTTGAELARNPERLEALYTQAKDLRPAIIFIDEADEVLADRQFSASTAATNKLLTLMDGVADRVRDVVWIAATNHPEQIDPPLLRGGRFSEKVLFQLPGPLQLAAYLRSWLQAKAISLEAGLDVEEVAAVVGPSSIANAEAVLQAAVNRAVVRPEPRTCVRREDLTRAMELLHGTPG